MFNSYHFVGVGGIGMSSIAQVLREQGHSVSGSDRNYDRQITPHVFKKLLSKGISLYPQNGSGVSENTNFIVVSSAIEMDNPDIAKAVTLGKKIIKRAELLAEMVNNKYGIAIGGSNGKTTVSSMVGYVLDHAGLSPTIIVGGCIKNYTDDLTMGNAKTGKSDIIAIEADESDGSIVFYKPRISVITNISKDHESIENLSKMFETFSQNTQDTLIINADCPHLKVIPFKNKHLVTFGLNTNANLCAHNVVHEPFRTTFTVDRQVYKIPLPGDYNVSNALAAIAVARRLNISDENVALALSRFMGVQRRMDIIGEVNGIKVIDDYAHNPKKVTAVINAIKHGCKRVIAVFQPHGYGPTIFMQKEFIEAFINVLSPQDLLFMPEIFYAGGTANKSISSADLINSIKQGGKNAFFVEKRDDIIPMITTEARIGDCIVVMGARDNTLTQFCEKMVHTMKRHTHA
jgi:UDP-N-acetylmuramate--alanine ligase